MANHFLKICDYFYWIYLSRLAALLCFPDLTTILGPYDLPQNFHLPSHEIVACFLFPALLDLLWLLSSFYKTLRESGATEDRAAVHFNDSGFKCLSNWKAWFK